jgi:AcrR family transcriptional regulator
MARVRESTGRPVENLPRSRPPRARRREEEILRAAADLFFRKGFHATSLEDIARAVGIRKSGLYYYARTKDDLLFGVVRQGLQLMIDELQEIATAPDGPEGRLRGAVENHVRRMDSHWSTMGVILREDRSVSSAHRARYVALRDAYEALFRGLVRDGVEAGAFRACDPATVARAILGMCSWLAVWYRPGGGQSPAALTGQFAALIFDGLRRAPARM